MGSEKEPNEGTVPCLVCRNRFEYLTSGHLSSSTCSPGRPSDVDSYREWVTERFDIDPDDPVFEPNQIQKPQYYREHAARLGLPR